MTGALRSTAGTGTCTCRTWNICTVDTLSDLLVHVQVPGTKYNLKLHVLVLHFPATWTVLPKPFTCTLPGTKEGVPVLVLVIVTKVSFRFHSRLFIEENIIFRLTLRSDNKKNTGDTSQKTFYPFCFKYKYLVLSAVAVDKHTKKIEKTLYHS